jgi:hypothetical protein
MRRALAPKDASSSSSAQQRAAALEENLEADCMPPPVAGVLPRAASPALQPVAGMDKEALAAFQKFLESSGMAGVSRDKIWVKETAEEQPKVGRGEAPRSEPAVFKWLQGGMVRLLSGTVHVECLQCNWGCFV